MHLMFSSFLGICDAWSTSTPLITIRSGSELPQKMLSRNSDCPYREKNPRDHFAYVRPQCCNESFMLPWLFHEIWFRNVYLSLGIGEQRVQWSQSSLFDVTVWFDSCSCSTGSAHCQKETHDTCVWKPFRIVNTAIWLRIWPNQGGSPLWLCTSERMCASHRPACRHNDNSNIAWLTALKERKVHRYKVVQGGTRY